jgi:hypothetical protein
MEGASSAEAKRGCGSTTESRCGREAAAVWESASRVYSPLGQILCGSHGLGRAPTISASPPLGHTLAKFSLDRALPLGAMDLLSLHGNRILHEHRPRPWWASSSWLSGQSGGEGCPQM